MTDPLDPDAPLDGDDEAVLAVLDGDASPEQQRRVARDAGLRARLAEQRAARDALATAEDEPPADLDRIRALALDAADETPPEEDDDADDAVVVPVAPRRPARARRLPPWPAVAAVVALFLGVGLALILNDRVQSGDDTAAEPLSAEDSASADDARQLGEDAAEGGGGAAPSQESVPSATSDSADLVLPTYADDDALRRVLEAIDPATLQPPGAEAEPPQAELDATRRAGALCTQGLEASDASLGPAQAALLVRVDGAVRLVLSNPVEASAEEAGGTRLTVFDPNGCVPQFAVQR